MNETTPDMVSLRLREPKSPVQSVLFYRTELTPYTANLRGLKNETQSVIFTEPTPYNTSLRELKNEAPNVIFTEPT